MGKVEIPFKDLVLHFRTIGSLVYVYVPKTLRKKFDPKAMKAVFLGYSRHKKAYLDQLLDSGKIVHFEHGYFDETAFPFISGVREKWFKNQLAGSADSGAGPSEQDIRSSLSDDLLSWDEQSHLAPEFWNKNVLTPVREQEKSLEENMISQILPRVICLCLLWNPWMLRNQFVASVGQTILANKSHWGQPN